MSGPFVLFSGLLVAHYLGDFTPLATAGMQKAKANGGPMLPIAGHAAVHGMLVLVVVAVVATPAIPILAAVAGFEFITHFGIDATRARLGKWAPILNDPGRNPFWYALGLDQLAHGLVLVALAAMALSA